MAMARETKTAFASVNKRLDKLDGRLDKLDGRVDKLETAMVKLAEGQTKLTEQVARSAGLINTLTVEVQHLGEHMDAAITRLGERMDGYAQDVVRGFTKRDEDHAALDSRVTVLERRP